MSTLESLLASLPNIPWLGANLPIDARLSVSGIPTLRTIIGQYTRTASTGTHTITGLGFQPTLVIGLGRMSATVQYTWSIGISTGTTSSCLRETGGGYVTQEDFLLALDDNVSIVYATIVSLDTDGFTLNYSVAGAATELIYLAVGMG